MSLSFSFTGKKNIVCDEVSEGHYFLASGGQDRMIHIYDVERFNLGPFELVQLVKNPLTTIYFPTSISGTLIRLEVLMSIQVL
jgi:hypothetical protein